MGAFAAAGGWLASMVRAIEITLVALVSVLAYSAGTLRRLSIRDRERRAEHRARARGRLLRWSFARLGATFVKVGQIMSSRPDLFSAGVIAELRWLQDRVPPFPFATVRAVIERELGAPVEHWFRELDSVAVAAGSVAQVHRAVLWNGDEVAIKVLRPEVLTRVRRDGQILLWLAHVSHLVSARARAVNAVGQTRDLVAGILAQTDLRRERNHYERFRRNFANTPGLAFPRVYPKFSTRWILTMEFIHGTRLDEAHADHLRDAARVIRSMFFTMCFDHGFMHADLHPGNVLITNEGGVVILDVGLVKKIPTTVLEQVVDFTRCLVAGSARDLVVHLKKFHRYLEDTNWDAVETDAADFIAKIRSKAISEIELSAVVGDLFALAHKHKIRPIPEMTLVLLGMVTSEGMAKRLDPAVDTLSELAKHFATPCAPRKRLARGSLQWRPHSIPRAQRPVAHTLRASLSSRNHPRGAVRYR